MISINTNTASSMAAYNVGGTNVQLQRSLQRLSSGSRINSSFDDAGGLAVSMKLSASIRRTEATQANVNNALSALQTQDGVLQNAQKVLTRMSELAQLSADVTKSTDDTTLYQTEFNALTDSLVQMTNEMFNGNSLFVSGGATQGVVTTQDGSQTVGITQADLDGVYTNNSLSSIDLTDITTITSSISNLDDAIQDLADLRATNGAEQQRMTFAADMLAINKVNLESANSRIADLDIAAESANLARLNILQQAGTAMLAQANVSQQSILRLLI